jgi:cephalosporin hydroxylase
MYVRDRGDQLRGVNLGFIPRVEIIGSSAEKRVIDHAINISKSHLYDILFIDGDHSYQAVKNDTLNYLPIVRSGGYVIFHDTEHMPDIKNWIKEIEKSNIGLVKVKEIAEPDEFTSDLPGGLGLAIFKKS